MSIASNVILENNELSNVRDAIIDKLELDEIPYYDGEDIKTLSGRLMYVGTGFFRSYSYNAPEEKLEPGTTTMIFTIYDDKFRAMANITFDVFINDEHKSYISGADGNVYVPVTVQSGDTVHILVKANHIALYNKTFEV